MRRLVAKDMGRVMKIIAKMDVKKMVMEMFDKEKAKDTKYWSIAVDYILNHYDLAEEEIRALVADLDEKTLEEIDDMPIVEYFGMVSRLFTDEKDFFSFAAKRTTQK